MRETYGVEVTLPQVMYYDATSAGTDLAPDLRELFAAVRERAKRDIDDIPCAHLAVRMRTLQEGIDAARQNRNWVLVGTLLEQAAKDTGGLYTNRRLISPEDPAEALARDLGIPADELRQLATGAAGAAGAARDADGDA